MSDCPQCFTGICKKHPTQNHGRNIKTFNTEGTLKRIYDQLVGSQLQKLAKEIEHNHKDEDTKRFREELDLERDRSIKSSKKKYVGSGLNPQALAAIHSSDESNDKSSSSSSSNSESDDSTKRRKKKKSKKRKKSDKKKSDLKKSSQRNEKKISRKDKKKKKRKRDDSDSNNERKERQKKSR